MRWGILTRFVMVLFRPYRWVGCCSKPPSSFGSSCQFLRTQSPNRAFIPNKQVLEVLLSHLADDSHQALGAEQKKSECWEKKKTPESQIICEAQAGMYNIPGRSGETHGCHLTQPLFGFLDSLGKIRGLEKMCVCFSPPLFSVLSSPIKKQRTLDWKIYGAPPYWVASYQGFVL